MKSISVTEFKSHCLQLLEEARLTGEPIEILKHGKPLATVTPAVSAIRYEPGMFRDSAKIVGEILVDGVDLGITWEALE